jgi:hypothetical protein
MPYQNDAAPQHLVRTLLAGGKLFMMKALNEIFEVLRIKVYIGTFRQERNFSLVVQVFCSNLGNLLSKTIFSHAMNVQ